MKISFSILPNGFLATQIYFLKTLHYRCLTVSLRGHPLSTYAKFSETTNISKPLIRTRMCAYQGVRNVSFSENFAYVLNGWPLIDLCELLFLVNNWRFTAQGKIYLLDLEKEDNLVQYSMHMINTIFTLTI